MHDFEDELDEWMPGEGRVASAAPAADLERRAHLGRYNVPDATTVPPPSSAYGLYGHEEMGAAGIGSSLDHTVMNSGVRKLFFSTTNVEALQQGIRYSIYTASKGEHVIGRQSDTELGLVMRSIYLQESRNVADGGEDGHVILEQVRALNKSVLDFCVPRILQELYMYIQYRRDISELPVVMDRAQIATTKGDRSLVMRTGF